MCNLCVAVGVIPVTQQVQNQHFYSWLPLIMVIDFQFEKLLALINQFTWLIKNELHKTNLIKFLLIQQLSYNLGVLA